MQINSFSKIKNANSLILNSKCLEIRYYTKERNRKR